MLAGGLASIKRGNIPCAEATSEGAVQSLSTPLIPHLLLPDRQVGAIVAGVSLVSQRRAEDCEGRMWMVVLEGLARSFVGHGVGRRWLWEGCVMTFGPVIAASLQLCTQQGR